jgi:hypothetical protein
MTMAWLVTISEYPSAGARAPSAVPVLPPAPAWVST